MNVAVGDLHRVIGAARKLGGKVVLGGHSLGGSVVTAYATWNFNGTPAPDDLAGLVYIDGGSGPAGRPRRRAPRSQALNAPQRDAVAGIRRDPRAVRRAVQRDRLAGRADRPRTRPRWVSSSRCCPRDLKPPVPVTNLGQYGYALNVGTSPTSLLAAQAHLGRGSQLDHERPARLGRGRRADADPALRDDVLGHRHQQRRRHRVVLPAAPDDDAGAVGNGLANPAQSVLDVHSTMGRRLPTEPEDLRVRRRPGRPARARRQRSLWPSSRDIPRRNLTLINRHSTYAHNDPAGAFPHNVFFKHLVPFLQTVARG